MAFIKRQATAPNAEEQRHGDRDCPGLREALSSPDTATRRWAARDLAACPDSTTALVERLKIETELSVREVILTTLTRKGDPSAIAGLVDCLRSEDAALRNETIEAMKQLPKDVAPIMRALLADADPDVRILTVNVLESLRHPEVEDWLIEAIERDSHVNVCATALDLLGEVGSEKAREPLARLKVRFAHEPYIQFAADLALRRLREG